MMRIKALSPYLVIGLLLLPENGGAAPQFPKGVYGMPAVAGMAAVQRTELLEGLRGIDAVFTPADDETIRFFKARGLRVFLSANAFGGKEAWRIFPDSRPVLADGRLLGETPASATASPPASSTASPGTSPGIPSTTSPGASPGASPGMPATTSPGASPTSSMITPPAAVADGSIHGGVCPTHEGWRSARLQQIGDWIRRFDGPENRIDGIWLDFIRYPGLWETKENKGTAPFSSILPISIEKLDETGTKGAVPFFVPFFPDACYCPRCLTKFFRDAGIAMPVKPSQAQDAATWLRRNRPYEWMAWKKEQINSFARDVRTLIGNRGTAPLFSAEKNRGAVPLFPPTDGPAAPTASALTQSPVENRGAVPPLLLGAFVVPWTKGEKDGAASFLLGQDAIALSEIVDVISPMLYHRMVGKDEAWVGGMTEYYAEQVRSAVWPIIQSEETSDVEFSRSVRNAALGGANGLLVYAHRWMDEGKRRALAAFAPPENLIPKLGGGAPVFEKASKTGPVSPLPERDQNRFAAAGPADHPAPGSSVAAASAPNRSPVKKRGAVPPLRKARKSGKTPSDTSAFVKTPPWPASWSVNKEGLGAVHGPRYGLIPATDLGAAPPFPVEKGGGAGPLFLAVKGGTEEHGEWRAPLPACEPGQPYRLSALFHRDTWNMLSHSYASAWGQRYLLEKHFPPRLFQPLKVTVICPQTPVDPFFRFTNEVQSDYFYLAEPKLVRSLPLPAPAAAPNDGFFYQAFFPIGVYGAGVDDLDEVRKLALNTAIIGGEGEPLKRAVLECRRRGLHYLLSPPHDPERLKVYLDRLAELPVTADDTQLAFYVDDEPEMRAVPAGRAEDVQRLIKGRYPGASTGMATVRPSYAREYLRASDFFMIDNYPFPNMPMSWLADSMDRAAQEAGRDRLLSVIQAFSDNDHWPSLPGWRQMDCLAFLSVVHGSRGIFFYTWSVIGKTPEGRANLGRVVGRLNRIYPWLLEKNLPTPVGVEMLSEHRVDPKGRPGVHAALKRKGDELMLIVVNTLGAPVEARLKFQNNRGTNRGTAPLFSTEVFSGGIWPVREGSIRAALQAYETKAFILK